jgi:hypothetical protein
MIITSDNFPYLWPNCSHPILTVVSIQSILANIFKTVEYVHQVLPVNLFIILDFDMLDQLNPLTTISVSKRSTIFFELEGCHCPPPTRLTFNVNKNSMMVISVFGVSYSKKFRIGLTIRAAFLQWKGTLIHLISRTLKSASGCLQRAQGSHFPQESISVNFWHLLVLIIMLLYPINEIATVHKWHTKESSCKTF